MTPRQQISQIDKQIDANRAAMIRRLGFRPDCSAAEWQRAWDRCPDLHARERDLYRQRGIAQQERDAMDHKEWQRTERQRRAKKCPTCGSHTLAA